MFGIVQGRLTAPPGNELQWFPQEKWQKEFELATKIGMQYIEFIVERQHNIDNPIWREDGVENIKKLAKKNKLLLHALCNDYVIDNCLIKGKKVVEQTLALVSKGKELGIQKLIIPLFENSELNHNNYKDYKDVIIEISDAAKDSNILICVETILNGEQLLEIFDYYDHSNISCVFDTGNRIAFKHDIYSDIILLDHHIKHVHIKDKTSKDENVLLGTGLVNFHKVFQSLSEIKYRGPYTFETTRGSNPLETAKYNLSFSKFFINDISKN